MKYLIAVLITTTFNARADWCDIKDKNTGAVQNTYEGACDQSKFGGPWGDAAQTVHVKNVNKQKEVDDAKAAEAQKQTKREQRLQKIKTDCASATGLVKDLCDQLLDN